MIVVSDTSAICYLLLIGEIEVLAKLYGKVLIPSVVQQELSHNCSPIIVKDWINNHPQWLIIESVNVPSEQDLDVLDMGEKAAIILAEQQPADLIIIDDNLGRNIASVRGLKVTGLLGVLNEAAHQNLVDFKKVITDLQATTFRASPKLIQSLLQQHQ